MFLTWIDEFLLTVKYMNITRAAKELCMTQSNLSRHLKQMEQELGFPLLELDKGHIALTQAGREFADGTSSILSSYRDLLERCTILGNMGTRKLRVHEPPYADQSAQAYFLLLEGIKQSNSTWLYDFVVLSRITAEESLNNYDLDIAIFYTHISPNDSAAYFANRGFSSQHLATVPIGAWIDSNHELARENELNVKQLSELKILAPNDVYSPVRAAYKKLFEQNGLEIKLKIVNTKSQFEFMRYKDPDCAFVFPQAIVSDYRLSARTDLTFIPIEKGASLEAYALTRIEDNIILQTTAFLQVDSDVGSSPQLENVNRFSTHTSLTHG